MLSVALQAIHQALRQGFLVWMEQFLQGKYGLSVWSNLRFQFFNGDIDFDNGVLFLHVFLIPTTFAELNAVVRLLP